MGSGAPKSHTLIVPSSDPETIFIPSGDKATDQMLCAFVFSALQLMSIAIILRTREKRGLSGVCIRQHGDMGPHSAASSKGAWRISTQTCNSHQRATWMRGRVQRVAPKLIANGESHALERGTSPARGLRIGLSRGGDARGEGGEGGVLVGGGARLLKGTRKKSQS